MDQKNLNSLLIIGCGGHAKVITDIALSMGIKNLIYQDLNPEKKRFLGNNVINKEINNYSDYFFVAIGDNYLRESVTQHFKKRNPKAVLSTLVHPSSIVSDTCSIGKGTVVMPLCVINSYSEIGQGVIINTKSSLDHDNNLLNYSSIAPGVVTGGNVKIGSRSAISIGTIIKNNVEIGSDTVIGASSYVNKNILSNCIAYGNPAKKIRGRKSGERYL